METIHTDAFDLAWKFVSETNGNIFLTGKAGSGKTTFLKYVKDHSHKNLAVAAPTGVAAINAGGITLHSMFHLPFAVFIPDYNHVTPYSVNKKTNFSQIHFKSDKLDFFN